MYLKIYVNQVINVKLADLPSRKTRSSIAELTRPARALKKKIKAGNKKPQGQKKTKTVEDAKYHNWFSPFTWSLIEKASRNAGWEMSASAIVREAKRIDAVTFANLSRTTVIGWIDRSGDTPRWTDSVLQRIERGNDPGHNNGGRIGILVSQQSFTIITRCLLVVFNLGSASRCLRSYQETSIPSSQWWRTTDCCYHPRNHACNDHKDKAGNS
jgi:hypothetical protein